MQDLETAAKKNRILSALPKAELHQLLPLMERVSLVSRQVLDRPGVHDQESVKNDRSGMRLLSHHRQPLESAVCGLVRHLLIAEPNMMPELMHHCVPDFPSDLLRGFTQPEDWSAIDRNAWRLLSAGLEERLLN
jgi:hypothetical protein